MSQGFHSGIYSFSDHGKLDRSTIQEDQQHIGYETGGGMLSEMFNFPPETATSDHHRILESQVSANYRLLRPSTASMQLFLMNPPQQRSPSPPHHHQTSSSSTTHLLHGFHPSTQFSWVSNNNEGDNNSKHHNHQGLSLSLSSLQHLEAAKAEELRIGDGGLFCYNQASHDQLENLGNQIHHHHQHENVGFNSSHQFGVVNVLRNSKYKKSAQELLEEFCSVGRVHLKKNHHRSSSSGKNKTNPNPNSSTTVGSSSSSKDLPPTLSSADRIQYQRRKLTLLTMLDEVDRRYTYYCEQMQMVVNSFDSVMGFGSATPYTVLAQKAMSRHFRCLKDVVMAQLKQTCELLGDKDGGGGLGVTKGETPRLKLLDQSLGQQRAFHQMGMLEQEAWRPQRGLPERSVTILRAWLFEHFLHPYPSDADKHFLARQTGLSRNQVSNWFINARVRLWKPMVEEMYQQESKEDDQDQDEVAQNLDDLQPTSNPTTFPRAGEAGALVRSEIHETFENEPSSLNNLQTFSTQIQHESTTNPYSDVPPSLLAVNSTHQHAAGIGLPDYEQSTALLGTAHIVSSPTLIRFGSTTTAGDVSLTLGLRHTGNSPESRFSVRNFRGC